MSQSPIATQPDVPAYVVPPENLVPVSDYPAHMAEIPPSRMFLIREALGAYKARHGKDAVTYDASQGDGGASLPGVPAEILQRALAAPAGARHRLRPAVRHRPVPQGVGRAVLEARPGDRLDRRQYHLHAGRARCSAEGLRGHDAPRRKRKRLGHRRLTRAVDQLQLGPVRARPERAARARPPEESWAYTPEAIRACVATAQETGRKIAGIVITSPDNPTGRIATLEEQAELGHAALEAGIPYVVYDWMYHWITESGPYDLNAFLRMFTPEQRERLIVIDGLTKSLGASNIRAAQLLASKHVIRFIVSQSSHSVIPSFFAQAVAIAAYEMGFENAARTIIEPTNRSRAVLKEKLSAAGLEFISGGGYYAFINCGEYIRAGGLPDSEGLLKYLGAEFGLAVVPGIYFSEAASDWVRFSYALDPELTAGACDRLIAGLNALKA